MADQKAVVVLSAKDKASPVFKKLGGTLKTALVAGAAAAAVGFAALTVELVLATQAANVQEEAEVKLAVALRSIGRASRETLDGLKAHAAGLQQITQFGDETTLGVQALLIQLGRLADTDEIERATEATIQFAAATGTDLKAAALLVAKAAQGQVASLSRYGLILDENIPPTEKFTALLNLMETNFGGTAEALGATFQGRFKQATNAFGDLQEEIGFTITQSTALQETLGIAGDAFVTLGKFVKSNRGTIQDWITKGLLLVLDASAETSDALADFSVIVEEVTGSIQTNINETALLDGALAAATGSLRPLLKFLGLYADKLREDREESGDLTDDTVTLSETLDGLTENIRAGADRIRAFASDSRDATDAILGLGEGAEGAAEGVDAVIKTFGEAIFPELPPVGEIFGPLEAGVEALKNVQMEITATNGKIAELGAALQLATTEEEAALLGEQLVNSIRSVDPELAGEALVEKLREVSKGIDFEKLAEDVPFFEELLRNANPEGVGAAVGDALRAAQGPITQFTGGITQLQDALSTLGLKGSGPFGKFAKATAKVQAVISTAQAIFEIAEAVAAVARFDFPSAAQHSLAAAKFQISATAGKTAQGAIATAAGGFVPMLPGASANSDSVMAALTPGELVIPKPFAQEFSNVLGRSGRGGRFQEGGVVGAEGLPEAAGGVVNVAILPTDPSSLGPLLDAMNEAVERLGFRMVASEVSA